MGRTVFLITRTTRYQNDKTVLKKKEEREITAWKKQSVTEKTEPTTNAQQMKHTDDWITGMLPWRNFVRWEEGGKKETCLFGKKQTAAVQNTHDRPNGEDPAWKSGRFLSCSLINAPWDNQLTSRPLTCRGKKNAKSTVVLCVCWSKCDESLRRA